MTLTNNTIRNASEYQIVVAEAAAAEVDEALAEGLAMTEAYSEIGDWIYDATAEFALAHQEEPYTQGTAFVIDIEDQPGLLYSGPTGAAVRATVTDLVVDEGSGLGAAEGAKVCAAICQNNVPIVFAEEGFVEATDTSVTFTGLDTYVTLTEGDCLQVALVVEEGAVATPDFDVTAANLVIV